MQHYASQQQLLRCPVGPEVCGPFWATCIVRPAWPLAGCVLMPVNTPMMCLAQGCEPGTRPFGSVRSVEQRAVTIAPSLANETTTRRAQDASSPPDHSLQQDAQGRCWDAIGNTRGNRDGSLRQHIIHECFCCMFLSLCYTHATSQPSVHSPLRRLHGAARRETERERDSRRKPLNQNPSLSTNVKGRVGPSSHGPGRPFRCHHHGEGGEQGATGFGPLL